MIEIIIIILFILLLIYNINICITEGFSNDSCNPISADKVMKICNDNKDDYDALFLEKETKINKINSLINTISKKQSILTSTICPDNVGHNADSTLDSTKANNDVDTKKEQKDMSEVEEKKQEQKEKEKELVSGTSGALDEAWKEAKQ